MRLPLILALLILSTHASRAAETVPSPQSSSQPVSAAEHCEYPTASPALESGLSRLLDLPLGITVSELRQRFPDVEPSPGMPGSSVELYQRKDATPLLRSQHFRVERERVTSFSVMDGVIPTGEWITQDDIVRQGAALVQLLNRRLGKPALSSVASLPGSLPAVDLRWPMGRDRTVELFMTSPRKLSQDRSDQNPPMVIVLSVSSSAATSGAFPAMFSTAPWTDEHLCVDLVAFEKVARLEPLPSSSRFFPSQLDWLHIGMSTSAFGGRAMVEDFMPGSVFYVEDSSFTAQLHARRGRLTSATFSPAGDDSTVRFWNWVAEAWGSPTAFYPVWKDGRYRGALFDWPGKQASASLFVPDGGPPSAQVRHALWGPELHVPEVDRRLAPHSWHAAAEWADARQARGRPRPVASVDLFEDPEGKEKLALTGMLRRASEGPIYARVRTRVPPSQAPWVDLVWSLDEREVGRQRVSLTAGGGMTDSPFRTDEPGFWQIAAEAPDGRRLTGTQFTVRRTVRHGNFLLELERPHKMGDRYDAEGTLTLPKGWFLHSPAWHLMGSTVSIVATGAPSPAASPAQVSLLRIPIDAIVAGATVTAKGIATYPAQSFTLAPTPGHRLRIDGNFEIEVASRSRSAGETELVLRLDYVPRRWSLGDGHLDILTAEDGRRPSRRMFELDREDLEKLLTGNVLERVRGTLTIAFPGESSPSGLRCGLRERADIDFPVSFSASRGRSQ